MPFCCQLSSILFSVLTFFPFIFPSQKNKYFAVTYLLLNYVFNVHCHLFCPIPLWSILNLLVGTSFCKWHSFIFYYFPLLKCMKWLEKLEKEKIIKINPLMVKMYQEVVSRWCFLLWMIFLSAILIFKEIISYCCVLKDHTYLIHYLLFVSFSCYGNVGSLHEIYFKYYCTFIDDYRINMMMIVQWWWKSNLNQ